MLNGRVIMDLFYVAVRGRGYLAALWAANDLVRPSVCSYSLETMGYYRLLFVYWQSVNECSVQV